MAGELSEELADLFLDGVEPTGLELGKGSFGVVFEVKWGGKVLAAKKLHDFFFESDVTAEKRMTDFMKECRDWSKFKHPNMVTLLGIYRDYTHDVATPVIHIVMEKMDASFGDYLVRTARQSFPLHKKVCVLLQVAQGLSYLHGQSPSLVHHDLKPDNIMINTSTFEAKLSDFGMIRSIYRHSCTRMSSVKGTPVFMPPEAMSFPPKYDEKLDVFSYGCIIISTLTHSKAPIPTGATAMINGRLEAVSDFDRRKFDLEKFTAVEKRLFMHIVESCLEFKPADRPSSLALVQEMALILAQPCVMQLDTVESHSMIDDLNASLTASLEEKAALSAECRRLQEENNELSKTSSSLQLRTKQEVDELHALRENCSLASNLPDGWIATFAPNGRIVYANHLTKKTQWTHPITGKPSALPLKDFHRQSSEPTQHHERDPSAYDARQVQSVPITLQGQTPANQSHPAYQPVPPPAQPQVAASPYTPNAHYGAPQTNISYPSELLRERPLQQPGAGSDQGYHSSQYLNRMPSPVASGSPRAGYDRRDRPLPHGWEARHAPDGQTYYANLVSGNTSWNRPSS